MSDAAVDFLVKAYNIDENKAIAIISFYRAWIDQEFATVPGTLTEEELLLLQQQQQGLPQVPGEQIQVSVPQSFGVGGQRPPPLTPEEAEKEQSWWEAVSPWGYMQVWQTAEPFIWPASIVGSGAGALYYGARGRGAYEAGLPLRAATPSGRLLGRILKGVPTRQLIHAKAVPELAERLARWYSTGRQGVQPTLTRQALRQAQYLGTTTGRNLLSQVTELGLPQRAVTQLTEKEILEAFRDPQYRTALQEWYRTGGTAASKPISSEITFARRTTQPLIMRPTHQPLLGTRAIQQSQQTQPGFWSRAGQSIRAIPSRITPGRIGAGGVGGLGIYGLGASTAIGAAIPAAGIIGGRAAGEVLAPEWNAELSRQGHNEWIRPWFPIITRAAQSQEEWDLQLAAIPYWQGWNQAWNQLTAVLGNIGSTQQAYIAPGQ